MNRTIRNIIVLLSGIIIGMLINMGLILTGSSIIPAPAGVDVTNAESIAASIELFRVRHFLFPFLAHSLGTLAGAILVAFCAASHQRLLALLIGFFFLIGGIASTFMIPAPIWFIVLDLSLAYVPMALLGWLIAQAFSKATPASEQSS